MEASTGAEVIFYEAPISDPYTLTEVQRLTLGVQDEEEQPSSVTGRYAAAAAGLVQLRSHRYLLVLSGRDNGRAGVWFYVSDQPWISSATRWKYIDFWEPGCAGPTGDCWTGADNFGILSQCDGAIYVVGMTGEEAAVNPTFWANVTKISQTVGSPDVDLSHVHTYHLDGSEFASLFGEASFRYGAAMTVTSDGDVVAEMSERDVSGAFDPNVMEVAKYRPVTP